jgi:HlyD family secretion protein
MKSRFLFVFSACGILAGILAAYVFGMKQPPLPPAFDPPSDPYAKGVYAEGIVESAQTSGANINLYPEVAGTVREILVTEGQIASPGRANCTGRTEGATQERKLGRQRSASSRS